MFFTCKYMKNFVNNILTFIVNGTFGSDHQGFFYLKLFFVLGILGELPWSDHFQEKLRVVCLLVWWKWAPSWVFLKHFAYFIIFLLCERQF